MQELLDVLSRHGLLVVFLLTLASRIGVPVPAAPLLVVGHLPATDSSMNVRKTGCAYSCELMRKV